MMINISKRDFMLLEKARKLDKIKRTNTVEDLVLDKIVRDNIEKWLELRNIKIQDFNKIIPKGITSYVFNMAVRDYCLKNNIRFIESKTIKIDRFCCRVKVFERIE